MPLTRFSALYPKAITSPFPEKCSPSASRDGEAIPFARPQQNFRRPEGARRQEDHAGTNRHLGIAEYARGSIQQTRVYQPVATLFFGGLDR